MKTCSLENGSSQGQNLALTRLCVASSVDSELMTESNVQDSVVSILAERVQGVARLHHAPLARACYPTPQTGARDPNLYKPETAQPRCHSPHPDPKPHDPHPHPTPSNPHPTPQNPNSTLHTPHSTPCTRKKSPHRRGRGRGGRPSMRLPLQGSEYAMGTVPRMAKFIFSRCL